MSEKTEVKRYKKKPIIIEAVQFLGFDKNNGHVLLSSSPKWIVEQFGKDILFFDKKDTLTIKTSEGNMIVNIGDYIIKEPFDKIRQLYPCKPDIFKETYEEVK